MAALLVLDLEPDELEQVARALGELGLDLGFERLPDVGWLARKPPPDEGRRGGKSRSAQWRRTRQNATRGRAKSATNRDTNGAENSPNSSEYQTDGPFRALSQSDSGKSATNRDATTRHERDATERDATRRDAEPLTDEQVERGRNGLAGARAVLDGREP